MKRAILIGCGAEIGSNLLLQNRPELDGFILDTVLTNAPAVDKHYPNLGPIDGIVARLALAEPGALSKIRIHDQDHLEIDGRRITFHFTEMSSFVGSADETFDIGFLATSKNDVSASSFAITSLSKFVKIILGAAEGNDLPSIYGCLADLGAHEIPTIVSKTVTEGAYCLGSCQSNGMHASLRILLGAMKSLEFTASEVLNIETDIIHPDTPNGVLGTRSFEGRMQDARDNLRPSFSQIAQSQQKVLPWAALTNTVSLRAPVHAPGYQINRFIIRDDGQLTSGAIVDAAKELEASLPFIAAPTVIPLGGRAYAFEKRCATILTTPHHLLILRPDYLKNQGLSEVILQSFVNNTVGYSAVASSVARRIAKGETIGTFERL